LRKLRKKQKPKRAKLLRRAVGVDGTLTLLSRVPSLVSARKAKKNKKGENCC